VEIGIFRDSEGLITGFAVDGHSGFAVSGQDIVCSAISALTLAAAMGLSKVAGKKVEGEQTEGHLLCRLLDPADAGTEMILATMLLGLQQIKLQYDEFITLNDL